MVGIDEDSTSMENFEGDGNSNSLRSLKEKKICLLQMLQHPRQKEETLAFTRSSMASSIRDYLQTSAKTWMCMKCTKRFDGPRY